MESGNDKSVIRGIGVVSCVYVNPTTERFWVIDYRIFDPDADGKTKLDHVREMLSSVAHRGVPFETVLMDTWYATKDLMLLIEGMAKKYYLELGRFGGQIFARRQRRLPLYSSRSPPG